MSTRLAKLLASASVEISSSGSQVGELADHLAAGADVSITFLPGDNYRHNVETAAALHIDIESDDGLPRIFDRDKAIGNHQTFLRNEGLMTLRGKGLVTSAHGDTEIQKTVEAYNRLLGAV